MVGPGSFDLGDRVPGEQACPIEPQLVAGSLEQRQERIAVPGGAVAQARSLGERSCPPGELGAGQCQILVEHQPERGDHPGCAVTPLQADGAVLDERPPATGASSPARPRRLMASRRPPSHRQGSTQRRAVRRARDRLDPAVQVLRPPRSRGRGRPAPVCRRLTRSSKPSSRAMHRPRLPEQLALLVVDIRGDELRRRSPPPPRARGAAARAGCPSLRPSGSGPAHRASGSRGTGR
jgi:hypothetical protein